ncbi:hypothetical protein HOU96_gp41 [Arthrobacter phage Maja]|uniref:Uncharacterized protein n=1 Tax=Arthrobacter phage Maja TaxID=2499009 RepID=A0A3S9UN14_9CAUD|nr:hypothetical protein HOU96_gp41 [Arthrobacter phage Maja]AZS11739.1 hypothetical protein PBI_MAJA_41 [Arthrobacter phage Maja]
MNKHGLTRNPENEPVCRCGFRPDVLDTVAPIGRDYPRASVQPTADGKWKLTLWDAPEVEHALAEDESKFDALADAYDYGALRIGACRQSGTNLNGMAVA